jgi:deoxyribose-phosphate aldolase
VHLTTQDVASMIDLSCVRTNSNQTDIEQLVEAAIKYGFGQVSVLQCFVPLTRSLLAEHAGINIVGNVSFPSGSDSTSVKVAQAKELAAQGCDEIDMVMNIGKLRSDDYKFVEQDVRAVILAVYPLPVKVIIEIMYLKQKEVAQACQICLDAGATFIKTGTGWADRGTTLADVRLIKSLVDVRIHIKASGGIRDLATLTSMYNEGATRFGVNLQSGIHIIEEAIGSGNQIHT